MPTAARSLLLLLVPALAQAQDGAALLAQVDRLRHPWPAYAVDVALGEGRSAQRWRVQVRENGDARVEGLSKREAGRSVLVLGDRMWLLLPGSRRPVPVTPQQRLLGPASGGDLARTRFAEDYQVEGTTAEAWEGQAAVRLDLRARRPALSWRTARLWVAPDGRPLAGDFFLPSGKRTRSLRFDPPVSVQGARLIPGLTVLDASGAGIHIGFDRWAPGPQDPTRFELPEGL